MASVHALSECPSRKARWKCVLWFVRVRANALHNTILERCVRVPGLCACNGIRLVCVCAHVLVSIDFYKSIREYCLLCVYYSTAPLPRGVVFYSFFFVPFILRILPIDYTRPCCVRLYKNVYLICVLCARVCYRRT